MYLKLKVIHSIIVRFIHPTQKLYHSFYHAKNRKDEPACDYLVGTKDTDTGNVKRWPIKCLSLLDAVRV